MKTGNVKNTTLCYIKKNDCFLMLYRNKKKNDENEGKWVGVGGKFEPGETPEECLVREVYEETGLKLTKYHFHGVISFISDKWDDEEMYLYTGLDFEGHIRERCDEGTLKWIPKSEILKLNMWEGDPYFLKPLVEGQKNISLRLTYAGEKLIKCESK